MSSPNTPKQTRQKDTLNRYFCPTSTPFHSLSFRRQTRNLTNRTDLPFLLTLSVASPDLGQPALVAYSTKNIVALPCLDAVSRLSMPAPRTATALGICPAQPFARNHDLPSNVTVRRLVANSWWTAARLAGPDSRVGPVMSCTIRSGAGQSRARLSRQQWASRLAGDGLSQVRPCWCMCNVQMSETALASTKENTKTMIQGRRQ
ncbi:hypothetical protein LZ32DRAFT_382944 [Colletotrichum eremochloae]|nr:hypothetical protein LZ32DRAFT_382944 [Colletotrichum eremochloae]